MLVTNVGHEMCWWQLWDVSDGFDLFCHQHPLSFNISVGHQHPKIVTKIKSPTSTCHQHRPVTNIYVAGPEYFQIQIKKIRTKQTLILPLSLSAFKYISFTSFASMVASRLKLELGSSGLHVSSTEKPRCSIWPLQQPSSRNKREQNWNTLSKINRYKWV